MGRSIIFDVDGTLWDSTNEVGEIWIRVARKHGLPTEHLTGERLKREFGKTMDKIAFSLFPELNREDAVSLIEECCEMENQGLLELRPSVYPEIPQLFRELYDRKVPIFIVSNCQAGYIEVMLKISGLGEYVTDTLCYGDTGHGKGYNIRAIVEKWQLDSPLYIGDTQGDADASKEADVPFVLTEYGFGSVPDAEYTISHPLELLELL